MHSPTITAADTRRGTRYILIAITLVALAVIIWKLSDVVVVIFGGIVGATALRAIALPLARRSGLSERWSLSLVLIGLLVVLGVLCWLFGRQAAEQATQMERLIPEAVHRLGEDLDRSQAGQALGRMAKQAAGDSKIISGLGLAAGSLLAGIADLLLIFFLSTYFAFSPREYIDGFLRLLPPAHRGRVKTAFIEAGDDLRQWLLAQLFAMLIIGVLVGTILGFMGVPLALLLGVLAGVLEFIPVVGSILFTIPGVLVAFTMGPTKAFYVLLAYIAVQQIESNIVIPLLQRWAVRLAPAITLLSVVIGGVLLGAPGLVFATPLAVVVLALVKHLYVEDTLERPASRRSSRPAAAS